MFLLHGLDYSFGQPSWPRSLLFVWSFCCWPSLPVSWSSFFWRSMPQTQDNRDQSTRCNTASFPSLLYTSICRSYLWMLWHLESLLCKQASLYQFALSPQRIVVHSTHPTSEAWSRRVCRRGLQEKIQRDKSDEVNATVESSPFEAKAFGAPTLSFSKCYFTLWCADCAEIEKRFPASLCGDEADAAKLTSRRRERPAETLPPPPAAGAAAGAACRARSRSILSSTKQYQLQVVLSSSK